MQRCMGRSYDVVVVGAGHAGSEAAHAAARLGASTLVLTLRRDRVGWMSCNPAVGGMGKAHLVREIDALGGLMGQVTDETGIQFRTLNTRRGPAVRGSRAQCDRRRYARAMGARLEATAGLRLEEGLVEQVRVEGGRVTGVVTEAGEAIGCRAVVITAGTFLNGVAHVGEARTACGREGDRPAVGLSASLADLGLTLARFKTGTTPRLDGRTVDWDRLEVEPGDAVPRPFSAWTDPARFPVLPQRVCHVTRTGPRTHAIIAAHLDRSALYGGAIKGIGPRYCPSVEDKIVRFSDRTAHTVYLEPDGLDTDEVYPSGLSTSLPAEVQQAFLRTIPGLEAVEILRPGYAIEYDYVPPRQTRGSLESRAARGLFLAGQINGTSGYEEAAAQGLLAGINAARGVAGRPPVVVGRREGYLGVLVDDLTTVGTDEPYRMFTSRAEHRLVLREDNADLRLSRLGYEVGLLDADRYRQVEARRAAVRAEVRRLEATPLRGGAGGKGPSTLATFLRRPETRYEDLRPHDPEPSRRVDGRSGETVALDLKYQGYVERVDRRLAEAAARDTVEIPEGFRFEGLAGLSTEVREKLAAHRPRTLGQAGRISGVTPAAVEVLWVHLRAAACG